MALPWATLFILFRYGSSSKIEEDDISKLPACIDTSIDPEDLFGESRGCETTENGPDEIGFGEPGEACLYGDNGAIEFFYTGIEDPYYFVPSPAAEGSYVRIPECPDSVFDEEPFEFDPGDIFPSLNEEDEG